MADEERTGAADTGGIFPRTRWSMVIAARDRDSAGNPTALEELCHLYWKPIYLFIRSRGNSPEQSEDLAQEFFYRLLNGHYLKTVEGPEKGRLRSFLCVLIKRFLADEYDKRMTKKRGGDWRAIPIDTPSAEALLNQSQQTETSPEVQFDRQWALDLLAQAVAELRIDYQRAGKEELFEALKPTISPQLESLPYARLAEQLDMTEGAVKVAVHRFRQRYRDCLHAALRETVADPDDTEDELRHLLSVFSRR